MKIIFPVPASIAALEFASALREAPRRDAIFAALSAPAIYDNRIDLTIRAEIRTARRYPYKRADESVN